MHKVSLIHLIIFIGASLMLYSCSEKTIYKGNGTVILLHGLARSSSSMNKLSRVLTKKGYNICNISYPSTKYPISILAEQYVMPRIRDCKIEGQIHFVTHSMGGIIVRYLSNRNLLDISGKVVMLGPPNKGSELVDRLGHLWLFDFVNGPAGQQLGTGPGSIPNTLGPVDFKTGIIIGNRSLNPLFSYFIEGADDGKVSTENSKVEGMTDFIILPANHTFIMRNKKAITQILHFLQLGQFDHSTIR